MEKVIEEFKKIAFWDETQGAFCYREDRYSGGGYGKYVIKQKGDIIDSINAKGYRRIRINGKDHMLHRLAFMVYHNTTLDSKIMVDHVSGDKLDNSKSNLRLATNSQNNANSKKRLNCSSQYKGVVFHKKNKRWVAYIGKVYLGSFNNESEAAASYDAAAKTYFGDFSKLNFP